MGGERKVRALRGKDAVAAAVRSLARATGQRVRPLRGLQISWEQDDLARGAYSWVPVGALNAQRELAGASARCTSPAKRHTSAELAARCTARSRRAARREGAAKLPARSRRP